MTTESRAEQLWTEYRDRPSPAVRDQLILQYTPLVYFVVDRLALSLPAILDREDLADTGAIGLIDAISRFDPARGVKFETYAIARIRGAILDSLRSLDLVPRTVRQKARQVEQAIGQLDQEFGRPATDQEVADHLGVSVEEYRQTLLDASPIVLSLDGPLGINDDGSFTTLAETIEDETSPAPAAVVERIELRRLLVEALAHLPDRERTVISLYYYEELTLREIAQILGLSESRVCQLHTRAIYRLRAGLQAPPPRLSRNGRGR